MQTLTRLLAQLREAFFPSAPTSYRHTEGLRRCLSELQTRTPTRRKRFPPCKESDDIAFCAWMYYLN